uniref:Zf-TFIIB domain-containing protein n=1 Tax=Streptomyces sp. NBC_00049 TaxID=2903617 RepID=A0AAU2JJL9_9ACTN
MQCPKCHAMMHTYNRNGVQIEQCSGCRGIFLDYGELEALTRLESQYTSQQYGQVPPPAAPPAPYPPQHVAPAPAWGAPHHGSGHGHGHHRGGFGRMLFSS